MDNESKPAGHTPGPWKVEGTTDLRIVSCDPRLADMAMHHRQVCLPGYPGNGYFPTNELAPYYGTSDLREQSHRRIVERDANAALIAAAPELLAALEELVCNFVNEAPHCSEGYTFKARAAIAKAKGAKA